MDDDKDKTIKEEDECEDCSTCSGCGCGDDVPEDAEKDPSEDK